MENQKIDENLLPFRGVSMFRNIHLIDYDGMYFPDLASLKGNELGHPNFQHPKRTANNYNKTIDRFSAIVIYTALKALSIAPSLWKKYDNGDNILFKGQDFADPTNSQLIKDLAVYPELSEFSNNLLAVSTWDFDKVPSLSEFISKTFKQPVCVTPSISTVRSAYAVIDGSQKGRLLEYLGQKVEVVGKVSAHRKGLTANGNPYFFLNFGVYPFQTFTLVIWSEALIELNANDINPTSLVGKYVSITGVLSSYNGNPQIAVDYVSQIQVLSGQSEVNLKLSRSNINASVLSVSTNKRTSSSYSKEDEILNTLYKNKPVSKSNVNTLNDSAILTYNSSPISKHLSTNYCSLSKNSNPSSTSSSSKSSKHGCTAPIIVSVIGAFIGTAAANNFGGFVSGAIIGCVIGLIINSAYKS